MMKNIKGESPFVSKSDKENALADIVRIFPYDPNDWGMDGLLKSYQELNVRDKLCLLCFSAFICDVEKVRKDKVVIPIEKEKEEEGGFVKKENEIVEVEEKEAFSVQKEMEEVLVQKNLVIKKRILIYWWVGEGLIPMGEEDEGKTIEQIGNNILNVLREKGFIEPMMKKRRESESYQMHHCVHAFVIALARKAGFFDFSDVDDKLTYRFTKSKRACLVKSQGKLSRSCERWKEAIDNCEELQMFANVTTLFNVNETIVDIQPEWFSKMKSLSVLHLGSWRSETGEHIKVKDPKFMEELKNMKQLKLFNLRGVATITKLPESVCKLRNLAVLDLSECYSLKELPANIGELKNLTHLDLTKCHLLTKLPKGISLLSKLQVLNWFVIYKQEGEKEVQKGRMSKAWKRTKKVVMNDVFRYENKEVCTLEDLLKLDILRELSIIVNTIKFPNQDEAQVLMRMRELGTLKIRWNFKDEHNDMNSTGFAQEQKGQDTQDEENSSQLYFEKLEILKLRRFPGNELPCWLVPEKLQKLKKLYIKGAKLQSFGANNKTWNVENLHLKYMKELKIGWRELIAKFPKMTYLEKYQCKQLSLYPCDYEGIWINK